MTGISLGGHTAYRLASLAPGQIAAYAIVVGCPSLETLLLSRLGIDFAALGTTVADIGGVPYDKLEEVMNIEQRRRWPKVLAKLMREGDRKAYEKFPTDVPVLLCNGRQDSLVPQFHTASWLEKRREDGRYLGREEKLEFFVQDNTGHSCTKEMVAMIAAWIGTMFELGIPEITSSISESRL